MLHLLFYPHNKLRKQVLKLLFCLSLSLFFSFFLGLPYFGIHCRDLKTQCFCDHLVHLFKMPILSPTPQKSLFFMNTGDSIFLSHSLSLSLFYLSHHMPAQLFLKQVLEDNILRKPLIAQNNFCSAQILPYILKECNFLRYVQSDPVQSY